MSSAALEYLPVMFDFVEGAVSPDVFVRKFQAKLQNESRFMPDEIFDILQRAFSDAESYTTNENLLRSYPGDYIESPSYEFEFKRP